MDAEQELVDIVYKELTTGGPAFLQRSRQKALKALERYKMNKALATLMFDEILQKRGLSTTKYDGYGDRVYHHDHIQSMFDGYLIGQSGNLNSLVELIGQWAEARNLVKGSDPKSQLLKTMSELGELADGINKQRMAEIKDGVGDVIVTLVIICEQLDITMDECLQLAYDEIKDRKGRMVDGVFIKEGDEGE